MAGRIVEKKERIRKSQGGSTGLRELYPTESGTGHYTRDVGLNPSSLRFTPASELEPRAIKCAQCGQPIEDHSSITYCPFCLSDNFLGRKFRNR